MQLRGAHANVAGTFGHYQQVDAGVVEELVEAVSERIVHDAAVLATHLVLGVVAVVHVVGWIGEGHVGELTVHQALDIGEHSGVAAQQTVLTQDPHIACFGDRVSWHIGHCIVFGQTRGVAVAIEQTLEFFVTKAHQIQIEVSLIEFGNLKLEQLFVPASVGSDAVVGQDVGFLLNCGEVTQFNHGHLG